MLNPVYEYKLISIIELNYAICCEFCHAWEKNVFKMYTRIKC